MKKLSNLKYAIVSLSILTTSLTVGTPLAQGALVFSTLDSTSAGLETVRSNRNLAYRFQTGTVSAITRSVRLDINQDFQLSQWTGATIRIYDDSGVSGSPGNELAAFPIHSFSSTEDMAVFGSESSLYELAANTNYWIAIMPVGANVEFHYTESPVYTGLSGYHFPRPTDRAASSTNGTSWDSPSDLDMIPLLSLETTAVPEPGTAVMLLAGLTTMLVRRRRRQ